MFYYTFRIVFFSLKASGKSKISFPKKLINIKVVTLLIIINIQHCTVANTVLPCYKLYSARL